MKLKQMRNFARELTEYMAGPPKISQTDFARKVGMTKSKLSRVLSTAISVDRETLDRILEGISDREARGRVVSGYLKDLASPTALSNLRDGDSAWAELDVSRLGRKGQEAFRLLVKSDHVKDMERILIDLAVAFGLFD